MLNISISVILNIFNIVFKKYDIFKFISNFLQYDDKKNI